MWSPHYGALEQVQCDEPWSKVPPLHLAAPPPARTLPPGTGGNSCRRTVLRIHIKAYLFRKLYHLCGLM